MLLNISKSILFVLLMFLSQSYGKFHSANFLSQSSKSDAPNNERNTKNNPHNENTNNENSHQKHKNKSKSQHRHQLKQDAHREVFNNFDGNNDGFVSMLELLETGVKEDITQNDAAAFIEELDYNQDFLISWEEYESALHAQEFGRTEL